MLLTFTHALAQAEPQEITTRFVWIVTGLLGLGGLGWLMAAALGFARARAFGEPARWFAVSAVCLLLYHVQWLVFAVYGFKERNAANVFTMGAFFNLFIVLGAVCSIVGFTRMTSGPRAEPPAQERLD
jgi:hypothetical protein